MIAESHQEGNKGCENGLTILKQIHYVSKLIYPQYPGHYFPIFLFIELAKEAKLKMRPDKIRLALKPMPNKLYDLLIADEIIKSEHIAFVSQEVFETFIREKEFSYINLKLHGGDKNNTNFTDNKVDQQLVKLVPWKNIQPNTIFIKENYYENFKAHNELKGSDTIYTLLCDLSEKSSFPKIATKASISLVKVPYELNAEFIDHAVTRYFESPRLLYRNYLYEICLDESILGTHSFSSNHQAATQLEKVYFKVATLETKQCDFEYAAIVAKNFTSLQNAESFISNIPQQNLDHSCFITKVPTGLEVYFKELKSCLMPFIHAKKNTSGMKDFASRNIYPVFMVQGEKGAGKYSIVKTVASCLGFHVFYADCTEIISPVPSQTVAKLKTIFSKPGLCQPLIICLENFEVFGIDHDGNEDIRIITALQTEITELYSQTFHSHPVIIIALFNGKQINPLVQRIFLETIKVQPPNENERLQLLKWLKVREHTLNEIYNGERKNIWLSGLINDSFDYLVEPENLLEEVAKSSRGYLFGDLKLLIDNAITMMQLSFDRVLRKDVMDQILSNMQAQFADSLGAPKVPKVLWSDIGGLAKLKEEIQSSIGLPLKFVHLMGKNMRRSGILLYGPPGTGKTLVAKAVATECNLSFLAVQGPELLNMYVGQSEQNVREVFERARSAAPCVIFLDELDSLAPNRGAAGDSGGVMDRVVSQILAEMDGLSTSDDPQKSIFILAATNRPDLIDPALLRPGRFDKLLYVGPCTTSEDKLSVLSAITNKFTFGENIKLKSVADMLKEDMTGADLYSICSNAWLSAVRRKVLENEENKDASEVMVSFEDFQSAAKKCIPSVSKSDIEYFNKLKTQFNQKSSDKRKI